MLGFGTVGSGVYRMLADNRASIEKRIGLPIEWAKIGIRDASKPRDADPALFTTDLREVVEDPTVDAIIEVMGGTNPAGECIQRALELGKHVVTANKELIAKQGPALMRLAAQNGLDLHFEAAVGGGIPLIQPLKHQLAGNDVLKMMGIVNGTTNYILTRMSEAKLSLEDALKEAQDKGYAEADPSADVDGWDARYKTAILASIAFSQEVAPDKVYCEGIRGVSASDIRFGWILGYRIKLLGIVEALPNGILARVHPTLLPRKHPLANVHDVYNAVQIKGDFVGDVIFSGRGAGSAPTASAVVGDLIDVGRNIRLGGAGNVTALDREATMLPIEDLVSRFYLRMRVSDRPKVLGTIAACLGDFEVSLAAMEMRVISEEDEEGEIVFLTHACREASFRAAIAAVLKTDVVHRVESWFRVEEMA